MALPTIYEHLAGLTAEALRDVARNESAPLKSRIAAVTHLIERRSKYATHEDYRHITIMAINPPAVTEPEKIVSETSPESEQPDQSPALKASVTTVTLMQSGKPAGSTTTTKDSDNLTLTDHDSPHEE